MQVEPADVDVFRFEAFVDEARRLAADDPAAAAKRYHDALTLWRGPALGDLADRPETPWTQADEIGTSYAADEGKSRLQKGPCP